MTFSTPIHTNEQSFDRVLDTGLPLLLVWHRPAATAVLDKTLAQLAIRFEGQVLIAKINAEENPELTQRFKVQSLPTLVFMRKGEEVGRTSGAASKEQLEPALQALATGKPLPALPQSTSEPFNAEQASGNTPLKLTDATFDQVIAGAKPTLVDFWAAWCGPCRTIAPSIDTLAREFTGRAVVGKLNVDENQRTAQRFNVMSIPTLLIFKGGKVVDQIVGVQPLNVLQQRLGAHV